MNSNNLSIIGPFHQWPVDMALKIIIINKIIISMLIERIWNWQRQQRRRKKKIQQQIETPKKKSVNIDWTYEKLSVWTLKHCYATMAEKHPFNSNELLLWLLCWILTDYYELAKLCSVEYWAKLCLDHLYLSRAGERIVEIKLALMTFWHEREREKRVLCDICDLAWPFIPLKNERNCWFFFA